MVDTTPDASTTKNSKVRLGGLWLQKSRDGKVYMAGSLGPTRILVFRNEHKSETKHPDYVAYLASNDRDDRPSTRQGGTRSQAVTKAAEVFNGEVLDVPPESIRHLTQPQRGRRECSPPPAPDSDPNPVKVRFDPDQEVPPDVPF